MMGKRLYKTYVNLSNIIVRISDGTEEGKKHALLVNSHLDSTLPSPGAADDALSVGVMLDCMRVLINTPGWSPVHAAIFCEYETRFLFRKTHLLQCSITQRSLCKTAPTYFRLSTRGRLPPVQSSTWKLQERQAANYSSKLPLSR
jgi:Zn-dependent M28 family amino/carboxypeptidase